LFADPTAFTHLIEDLSEPFMAVAIDYVAGIDALGFILGTAIALRLNKGFIPLRKGGKLPVATIKREFVDYTGERKSLELRKGALDPGDAVLIVDEWIETGAQVQAAIDLVEQEGGKIAGVAAISIDSNPVPTHIREKYLCRAIWFDMKLPGE
jgi:adenine phosphoribosyltransferase